MKNIYFINRTLFQASFVIALLILLSGCAGSKKDLSVKPGESSEPALSALELTPAYSFLVNNEPGSEKVLTDHKFGEVMVTVESRYVSALGDDCVYGVAFHTSGQRERIAACLHDEHWIPAPRIFNHNSANEFRAGYLHSNSSKTYDFCPVN